LLISGELTEYPVAWHGPIMMTSRKELMQAFKELNKGSSMKPVH